MSLKWYEKDDGKTILQGEEDDIRRHHPQANEIPDRPDKDHIWRNNIWIKDPEAYLQKRAKEFPAIEDQLDAVLKQFQDMKLNGTMALAEELTTVIDAFQAVKQKYPKPEETT